MAFNDVSGLFYKIVKHMLKVLQHFFQDFYGVFDYFVVNQVL